MAATPVSVGLPGIKDIAKEYSRPSEPSKIINVTGPIVQIQGSADEKTAQLAAEKVADALERVIMEPSSISAPSTAKRIRVTI